MLVIALTALVHAAEPLTNVVGVAPTVAGWQESARHAVLPGLGLWATHAPRPWAVSGEVFVARGVQESSVYRFSNTYLRASALGELAVGGRASTFHAGLGPALAVRTGRLDDREPHTRLDPGLRARVALTGPLVGPLAYTWHTGSVLRYRGVDYDVGVGLGVGW